MKKIIVLALSLICAVSLVACGSSNKDKDGDRVEVYDKNQKMISEMTSQKDLKYISELIAKSTESMKSKDFQLLEVP